MDYNWAVLFAIASVIVYPDGSGDVPTIQAGVDAIADGDVVELADGEFTGPGNVDVHIDGRSITIRSLSGDPEACIVDCQGGPSDPHRALLLSPGGTQQAGSGGGHEVVITGIEFRGGWTQDSGGSISCNGVRALVDNCRFVDNHSDVFAGAVFVFDTESRIVNSYFGSNAALGAGAIFVNVSGRGARILGCVFERNTASGAGGGAIGFASYSWADVEFSTFVGNSAVEGGALYGFVALRRCTFAGNSADFRGGAIYCRLGPVPDMPLDYSIVWGNCAPEGADVYLDGCSPPATCSIVDTAGVVVGGPFPGGSGFSFTNLIAEDPLFCAPVDCIWSGGAVDVTVSSASPARPDNNVCGAWIGASEGACGIVPVLRTTWSRLKARHR